METPIVIGEENIITKYGKRVFWRYYQMPDLRQEPFLLLETTAPSITAIPITKEGYIVVLEQFRYGTNEFVFEFPSGGVEVGQSPEDAVRSEIDTETGYSCGAIISLGGMMPFDAALGTKFIPYLATGCVYKHPPCLEANEILRVIEMPAQKLFEQVTQRELVADCKTLAMLMLALPYLG
jgi:ADP-ribose pyrophosphatase